MKKAIKINLSGIIFHIDDDAYEKLKAYLDSIDRHFSNKQESKEIIDDIESRIAELFQERITADNQVISLKIVHEVIGIMGTPHDIADSGEEAEGEKDFYTHYSGSRRLYRDPEDSELGGVCGGLGAYFGIDPVIFRILFIVFFFVAGSSILIYFILWLALPKAETAAQKLEMRGQKVNVENLEKKIREEYDNIKDNVKDNVSRAKNSDTYKKTRSAASEFFGVLGKVLLVFVKVVLIIIGIGLVFSGLGILIGLITFPFAGINLFPFESHHFSLGDILIPFTNPVSLILVILALSLLILIPLSAMLYGLIRLIFNLERANKGLGIGAIILWIISLLAIIGIGAVEGSHFSDVGRHRVQQELLTGSDTLVIKINTQLEDYIDDESSLEFGDNWFIMEDASALYGEITLDLEKAEGKEFEIDILKKSRGRNWEDAKKNAARLDYSFRSRGNDLILDPYFSVDTKYKWRFPQTKVIVGIPEGKVLVLDRETRDFLEGVRNLNHLSAWNMAGKTWKMTEDGLEKIAE